MTSLKTALLAATLAVASHVGAANAGLYQFSVTTGLTNGAGFNALPTSNPFAGPTATATFTYSGDLNFANRGAQNSPSSPPGDLNSAFGFTADNVSNYSGSGTVTLAAVQVANFGSEASFLSSSGSVSGYAYGSLYTITLGALAAGTNLVLNHDDGISLFRGGAQVTGGTSGPTSEVTSVFNNLIGGEYTLYYSRQNGTPSVLIVAVPEPASMALLGAGLLGLGLVRRRKAAVAA